MRHLGVMLIAAWFALVPLVVDTGALVQFALPKAYLSQALAYGIGATLLILIMGYGRRLWVTLSVHWAVLAFAAAHVIATAFALDRYLALFGSWDRHLGLISVLGVVVLYFGLVLLVRTGTDVRLLVGAALFGATVAMLYGLMQRLGLDPIDWVVEAKLRPVSTSGNATVFGHYMAVMSAGALALATRGDASIQERLVLAGLAIGYFLTAIATGTRAVLLALPVVALLVLVRGSRLVPTRYAAMGRVLVPMVVLLGLVGAVVLGGDRLMALIERGLEDRSTVGRAVLYEVAFAAVQDRLLTGVGPDNFEVAYPSYRPERAYAALGTQVPETSPHGWLSKLVTDAGVIGLGTFAMMLIALVYVTVRRGLDEIRILGWSVVTAYLAVGLVSVTDPATLWLLWAGVAASARGAEAVPGEGVVLRRPVRAFMRNGALGIAGAFVLLLVPGLIASHASRENVVWSGLGDPVQAATSGRRAISIDPRRAIYWHHLAVAYGQQARYAQAVEALREAVAREPHNAVHRANLARALVGLGQQGDQSALRAALSTARQAVERDPNNPDAHFALAMAAMVNQLPEEAARESERGRNLNDTPSDIAIYEVAARAHLALGQPSEAERWCRDGLRITRVSGIQSVSMRVLLARALIGLSRFDEALSELNAVLRFDPANEEARRIKLDLEGGQR